ncbi:hypothetical protein [Archangium lansingense]|uniref:Transglycosylase SLT domain-containing protein n=1 Tax=Archangium lansingense TaxID=2995310 RepID=A0ABT3ZVQ1_9BACT|nr:hypothetical protein [Archangium lansinium]MCY1073144.1 hypothetical protein [Archangium lansinium]
MTTPFERREVRIDPGSEGVFRLVVVPHTTLTLKLADWSVDGRTYKFKLTGTHKNLPAGTKCRVQIKTNSFDISKGTDVSDVPMQISGTSCRVDVEFDLYKAGLFGEGLAELSVFPDFPSAPECKVSGPMRFTNTLGVTGATPGEVRLGQLLTLVPKVHDRLEGATLRLSVFREGTGQTPNALAYSTFDWTTEDKEERQWQVGCATSEGSTLLTYLGTGEGPFSFDVRLELVDPDGLSYLLWEKAKAVSFPKPKLEVFKLTDGRAEVKVSNVAPSFMLPLELGLWEYKPLAPLSSTPLQVMTPITRPVELVPTDWASSFLVYAADIFGPATEEKEEKPHFLLLRIPKTLSGTTSYVPVSSVMDYDPALFHTFDDDQLWLEPPKTGKKTATKQAKTPRDLATAIASSELAERKIDPTRTPFFGLASIGVQDNSLCLTFKLAGDAAYWKAAAPAFSIYDETEQKELVKLTTAPVDNNPRLLKALVPLSNKSIFKKKVVIRGKITKPEAKLWGQAVVPPVMPPAAYECVPSLAHPRMSPVVLADDSSYLLARCQASYIPNGKQDGSVLAFTLYELLADLENPVLMTRVKFRYDISKGGGGLSDAQGFLTARILDTVLVRQLQSAGRYLLEASVVGNKGKVLSTDVPKVTYEFGGTRRSVAGTLIWGEVVPPEFRKKVFAIADELKVNPQYLMACMAFETGGEFKANTPGKSSNAFGLIQFMPTEDNEKITGVKAEVLRAMTEVEQLDYVQKYFRHFMTEKKKPLVTLGDVYACILWPAGIGKADTEIYFRAGEKEYVPNSGLDKEKKGFVTKADATAPVKDWLDRGWDYRL